MQTSHPYFTLKEMKYSLIASLVISLLICKTGTGQKHFNNWYFGINVGVTFNTIPPSSLTGSQINHLEGCATVSNNDGELLFYTDGVSVWDKNHTVMPNGTLLGGNWSASQSALIVPAPGQNQLYYIFTVTDWMHNGDLRYSLLDMSLNGGLGGITASQKNLLLSTNQTEKLVSAKAQGCGVWVISHQRNNNRFQAHLVTNNGIQNPVYSDAGSIHNSDSPPPFFLNNLSGVMKISNNNQKLGLATLERIIELFDFDPATGQLSNPISLPMSRPNQGYGVCFSPDNSKFYITESNVNLNGGYDIFQFDLSDTITTSIINSKKYVGTADLPVHIIGDLQTGPDNKIYFTRQETNFLGVIPNPNLPAPLCGFINDGIFLGAGQSKSGLPNSVNITENLTFLGNDTALCSGDTLPLSAPDGSSYVWSTGQTTQSISINADGQYWVLVNNVVCTYSDTINIEMVKLEVNLGNDTTICQERTISLNGGTTTRWLWSTGQTTQIIDVAMAGQYWVKSSIGNCSITDTINVTVKLFPQNLFPRDTIVCNDDVVILDGGIAYSYLWSNGDTTKTIEINKSGNYSVILTHPGNCKKRYDFSVEFEKCSCILMLPTAFTPNNDGINDVFRPVIKSPCDFIIIVIFFIFRSTID